MIEYSDNSGESFDDAIVISGAENTSQGIAVEYQYIKDKYGEINTDWKRIRQRFKKHGDKAYDILTIKDKQENEIEIYFDITEFFGR